MGQQVVAEEVAAQSVLLSVSLLLVGYPARPLQPKDSLLLLPFHYYFKCLWFGPHVRYN